MNSKFTRVIITLVFALFFISVKAAPTGDAAEIAERGLCGARMGSSCLSVVVDGSDDTSSNSDSDASSLSDDTFGPLETSSSESSETPSSTTETPSSETPVAFPSPVEKEPTHRPGPVNQDTPELASPVEAAAKSNGALTKHQTASTLLPVVFASFLFVLFA